MATPKVKSGHWGNLSMSICTERKRKAYIAFHRGYLGYQQTNTRRLEKREKVLIKKCRKGDAVAQRALYLRYRVRWYMTCLRYAPNKPDADDMLQEGLINIFNSLGQFDPDKGSFGAWSNRVLVNAILQYIRKWKRLRVVDDLEAYIHTLAEDEVCFARLGAEELTKMIQKLPEGYRIVFNLYVIEGYKHHEIAQMLGISESTSKTQLFKAKRMLRMKLGSILQQ